MTWKNLSWFLLSFLLVLAFGAKVQAQNVTFTWSGPPDPQATILRIYMERWDNPVGEFAPDALTATVDVDLEGDCRTFWAVYANDTAQSDKSQDALGCATTRQMTVPGGFSLTLTVEPIAPQ